MKTQMNKTMFTLTMPATDKEGFINKLKLIANALESGNAREAAYQVSDAIDTLSQKGTRFSYPKISKSYDLRGTMSDAEWSRIVD